MKALVLVLLLSTSLSATSIFYRSAEQQADTDEDYPCGLMTEQFNTHKLPKSTKAEAAPGKALLYVMVGYAGIYQNRIGVDGRWAGATKGRGHIAIELEPGEHRLCGKLRTMDPAFTKLTVEAGKTYYLRLLMVNSGWLGRIAFEVLDDREAERELKGSTFYGVTPKQQ